MSLIRRRSSLILVTVAALSGSACADEPVTGERAASERGQALIAEYGCGSCHAIPRIEGADGVVGPPLDNIGERKMLAGRLANTPENMIRWISDPDEIDPLTAMPDMGISTREAQDIAAFLRTLR